MSGAGKRRAAVLPTAQLTGGDRDDRDVAYALGHGWRKTKTSQKPMNKKPVK